MVLIWQKLTLTLLTILTVLFPSFVFADVFSSQCSKTGYTILTINGIFTDEIGAKNNSQVLASRLPPSLNNEPFTVDYLLNPSHLAGLGDLVMSAYQKVFDNETVKDYDLVEMLKDASEKVKTQKLLLVAHSQGNFYANSFYDTVAGKDGGVPAESIGVYAVATPASRVAGGGKWFTSNTDKIIADWVSLVPFKKIMAPNTSIVLAEGDDPKGHNFSGVYLKHRGSEIVSAIQSSLDKLQTNKIQNESSPCLAPPKLTLAHKVEGKVLAVIDPKAKVAKDGFVIAIEGTYQAGQVLAKGIYSLTNLIAGAVASVLPDNKPPIKTYSLWVGAEENIAPADNSQPATLIVNKIVLAEESLQDLQKQALFLQNQSESFSSSSMSRRDLDIDVGQSKFATIIIPGFGGGGDGAVSASSSSSADSSSSAELSSSSVESSSSSLPAEEAGSSSSSSSSSSASESSSSSAPDTTPPSISSFSISQCQNSLSSDGCLIATTTAFLSWASSSDDLEYFELTSNGTTSTTTATSTSLTLADNSNNSFSLRAKDLVGNWSTATTATAEVSLMPVVINEVAWAGNSTTYSADEWIELYNRTNLPVNLSNFILYSKTDLTPYVNLSGQIVSNGYYLLERTNDNTISNITADQIYTGDLVNFGENLALVYKPAGQATTTIDEIPYDFNWYAGAGTGSNYYSMERYSPDIAGTVASNWGTNNGIIRNGRNAVGGSINGTPKARNSVNYLINKGNPVSSNLTLSASNSPYLVDYSIQTFNASSTLTIEPGVVIKFNNNAGLSFANGAKILAQGTADNPIVFTSFDDDTYGGDTNGDTASTTPYWGGVRIDSPGAESIIDHAVFRYGGRAWTDGQSNLHIANSSATITNSIFEYSKIYGVRLSSASTTFSGNIFRHNNNSEEGSSTGLYSEGGNLTINSNSFSNNRRGLYFLGLNSDSIFNSNTFNSNTFTSNTNEAVSYSGKLGSFSNNSGSGNGVNAISLSGTITRSAATTTLLANSLPYLLNGNVTVAASSTLAVNSGVAIRGWTINSFSYLNIYGNLVVSGTNFSDIIFGSMFSSPAKGNWGGVKLYPGSYSSISGATFEYAGTALTYTDSPLNLTNVKFNENNLGVSADSASRAYPVNVSNVTFTNNTATTSPGGLW